MQMGGERWVSPFRDVLSQTGAVQVKAWAAFLLSERFP